MLNREHEERIKPWIDRLHAIHNNRLYVVRIDPDTYKETIKS